MTAAQELITKNLDIWSSAIKAKSAAGRGTSNKIEVYGIKKLRTLILELAMQGLLAPQEPNDEPASELLKKIRTERQALELEGNIKTQIPLERIETSKTGRVIPIGWEMERFGNLAVIERGGSPRPIKSFLTNDPGGLNWIKIGDTDIGGKYINSTAEKIIKEGLKKTRMVYPGDFLLTNSMSFGRPYITEIEGCIHDGWLRISPTSYLDKDYLYWLLSSPYVVNAFKDSASGGVVQNLNSEKVREVAILIPPLAEQHRIVAKVDELMALCDQLEQQQTDSISAHQTLVQTLLDALTNASERGEFESAWTRIAQHFDTLFTTEHSIDQLKQTILQLAVMGKLVPQNPNDEPASSLLEKIAKEKAKLIKEGKIKKQKPIVDFAGLDSILRKLPENWAWVRLNDIADIVRGGSPRPAGDSRFYGGSIPFLKVADVTRTKTKYVEEYEYSIKEAGLKKTRFIDKRTVLLTNSGATLGIPAICEFPTTFNDGIAAFVELSNYIYDEYLYLYLKRLSKWFIDIASRGQGQPNLNTDIIKATWFALPPTEEQIRIVARVDELMRLCEEIKTQLSQAQTTQLQLADAISS